MVFRSIWFIEAVFDLRPRVSPRRPLPDRVELLDQFLSLRQRLSQSVEADLRLNNCSFSCLHIAWHQLWEVLPFLLELKYSVEICPEIWVIVSSHRSGVSCVGGDRRPIRWLWSSVGRWRRPVGCVVPSGFQRGDRLFEGRSKTLQSIRVF